MLAYFSPPLGGAGVQRTLKFVKYLPEYGWDPMVVTVGRTPYPARDTALLAEVPSGVRVLRAPELPVTPYMAMALTKLGQDRARPLVSWPDLSQGWLPAALALALREIRRSRPDVLYTTSAPYSAHLAGLALHRLTGVPWVADFRDEWAANPQLRSIPSWLQRLSRRCERAVAARARVVVVDDYFEITGTNDRVTIPNGVDADDLEGLQSARSHGERFRLTHVGTLCGDQDCGPVLMALRRLVQDGRLDPDRLELRVVGNVFLPDGALDLPIDVTFSGYVSHRDALAEMRRATALLLYVAAASRAPSGKLYEYLSSERPILCVARTDNLAHKLVAEWGAGACAPPDDSAAVERALLDLYQRWQNRRLDEVSGTRERTLERFSRRALAGRLAGVLDDAAG